MPVDTAAGTSTTVAELQRRVDELSTELHVFAAAHEEALQREAAVVEILQVINSAAGQLAPVFQALLDKAMELCGASFGGLWVFEGGRYVMAALHGVPKAYEDFLRKTSLIPGPGSPRAG
jgi:two-component system, NtrC family, sensor kinase